MHAWDYLVWTLHYCHTWSTSELAPPHSIFWGLVHSATIALYEICLCNDRMVVLWTSGYLCSRQSIASMRQLLCTGAHSLTCITWHICFNGQLDQGVLTQSFSSRCFNIRWVPIKIRVLYSANLGWCKSRGFYQYGQHTAIIAVFSTSLPAGTTLWHCHS